MRKDCSVIILAAGRSSRVGTPKFALPFKEDRTFLEEIVGQYHSFGCEKIIVVLNREGVEYLEKYTLNIPDNVVFVTNLHLEWERFYSIKLGVEAVAGSQPVFIHNVDNPFVNIEVLQKLNLALVDMAVPLFNGRGGHPILISEHVQKQIQLEKKNDLIFSDFLTGFKKKVVDVDDENILVNINTKEAYDKLFQ